MNIDIKNLPKKITSLFKRRQAAVDTIRDPAGDWGKLVIVFSILFLITAALHAYMFYKLTNGEFGTSASSAHTTDAINRDFLRRVADYYTARDAKLIELKASAPAVVDPSL